MASIFGPGSPKTAKVPVTVIPAGLPCQAEIFLGPNDSTKVVTSGPVNFTSTGAAQQVSLPVTMPTVAGSYHVYINITSGGYLIAAYVATDDVVIPSAVVGPPVWS